MFEHMMFRGTDRLGPEEHFTLIRRTGGDCNAYTTWDNTTYIQELPSDQLELALWLEAERMAFLRIDEEGFYTERKVVEEERRLRTLNTPYGMVMERLLPVLFTKHPYRWSPIGQIPHLRAATIDELQRFWDTFYVPRNATLVIVGDIRHDRAHALAKKYFGWIPNCPPPPSLGITEPPQSEQRKIVVPEKKGPVPLLGVIYRAVPQEHADALPLEMLMSIVGGGESSRIYRDLVKERKLAQAAFGSAFGMEDAGLVGAGAAVMPWADKKVVLEAVRGHLEKVKEELVTERELEKVRNQFLRNEVTGSLSVASKASLLGSYEVLRGGAEKLNQRLELMRAVTREDLQRVARTYLVTERETEAIVQPKAAGLLGGLFGKSAEDEVDEGAAPLAKPEVNRVATRGGCREALERPEGFPEKPPRAPITDRFPEAPSEKRTFPNGLEVVVIPNHEVPFVTMTLGLTSGAWTESKPGTASSACSMITQGSAGHTAAQMAEELEYNAISLGAFAGMDTATVNASCVTDKVDTAMELMAEAVRTPTFPESEFDILRQQTVMGLMIQTRTPEYMAGRELRQRLYGSHPYARSTTGEVEDVKALTVEDLRKWWGQFVRPKASVLYIAGDITPLRAFSTAEAYFADWKPEGEPTSPTVPPIPSPTATHLYLVDKPDAVQSQIRVGHVSITRKDERYFPSRVLSTIFGGGFNSRLNSAIRVEKGLTYGARGGISASRYCGEMSISTFTKTPSTAEALRVILAELEKIRSSPVTDEELDIARSYIVGGFAGDRETPSALVTDLWLIRAQGLPEDYLQQYLAGVKNTTTDRVLQTARDLFLRDQLTIVVVGPAEQLRADLEQIAPVTVVQPHVPAAEPPAPEGGAETAGTEPKGTHQP
jgi:zinc protease